MNIKRPSVLFLGAFIFGIISAYANIPMYCKIIIFLIAIIIYLKLFYDGKIKFKILIIVLLFIILGFYRFKIEENVFDNNQLKVENLGYGNKIITGVVDTIGKSTNSNYYIIKNCEVDGIKLGSCRCYFSDEINPYAKIGNFVKVEASVQVIDEPLNEGEFNQKNYYRSEGISFISFAKKFEITNTKYNKLKQEIYDVKIIIKNQISKIFDEKDAGLFTAMVTGDKSTIAKVQKKLFSDNGIAHILAISGLHLSILGLAFFEILRKKLSVNISAGIVSIFILLYGIFIDAGATSLRAITMLYVRFFSLAIGRTYDSKNTLYIICFIFLMLQPYLIFNAGFQFSYVAIFALNEEVILSKKKQNCNAIDAEDEKTKENVSINNRYVKKKIIKVPAFIMLTLFLFPITIYHYFTYPLYSILLNLIVIPLMSFVLGFGLLGLFVSFVFLPIGKIIVVVVHIIFFIYENLCYFIEKLPLHILWLGKPTIYEIIYFYVALFLIIFAINNRFTINDFNDKQNIILNKKNLYNLFVSKFCYIQRIIICILLMILSIGIISIRKHSDLRMTFVAIGQGDSILIESQDMVLTIDGGSTSNMSAGQYTLIPHIKSRALSHIDYAFITHPDSDHTNAILYLMENENEVKLKKLVLPVNAITNTGFDKLKIAAKNCNAEIIYAKQGDEFKLKENLLINVLNPNEKAVQNNINKNGKENFDVNDLSLVFKLTYNNRTALFTGDIGKKTINRMLKDKYTLSNIDVDVLKVPHHGSKNSKVKIFFEEVSPQYAIISYGRNSYGHPHKDIIDALEKVGANILRTKENGQIDIYFDKENIEYKMYRKLK